MLYCEVIRATASSLPPWLQTAHNSLCRKHSQCLTSINLRWQWWRRTVEKSISWILTFPWINPGVQARTVSLDEPATLPRRRFASDEHNQNGPDESASPDIPVRSPVRCVSPEFVNAIAMNPGGRPKEVNACIQENHIPTLFLHIEICSLTDIPVFIPIFLLPETHAQLPWGLWRNGWWAHQPYTHSWWWGVSPNPCLPHLAANPLLQPV